MSLIYLAHPIDQSNGQDQVLEGIRDMLGRDRHAIYDPAAAWTVNPGAPPTAALQQANHDVLGRCDALVAVLRARTMSIGVPLELNYAALNDIPACVVSDLRPSWALAYLGIPQLNIDQLRDWLKEHT